MTKRNTSIEINGKRYDAISGALLTGATPAPVQSMDAIVSTPTVVTPPVSPTKTATPTATRTVAASAASHVIHPSATLMRHAVTKPTDSFKKHAKVQAASLQTASSTATVLPKRSLARIDPSRRAHAAATSLSSKVSRFGAPAVTAHVTTKKLAVAALPVSEPAPARPLDIFERALEKATSHQQPPLSRQQLKQVKHASQPHRKLIHYGAISLAVVLVAGFIAYQNVANVTLKMAADKAGFAATLPGYRPAGFSLGNFNYSAGNVAINYKSNGDNRHFALLEKPSNWDSATLRTNVIGGTSYHTVAAAGRTVYVYGQNSATWVDNGVLYQIPGNNALSDRQLSAIAAST